MVQLVVTQAQVRDRYSLQNRTDINAAIDSALISAHHFFQGVLGTVWENATGLKDIFYLNDDLHPYHPNNQYRLRLKRAFLHTQVVPTIKVASSRKYLLDGVTATTVPTTDYFVDYDKGLIFLDRGVDESDEVVIDSTDYRNQWVSVTYDAGFDGATWVAPQWLQEAVLSWMASVMLTSAHTETPDKVIRTAQEIQNQAADMISQYKRETSFQFTPVY